jgi:hypothetical protein
LNHYSTGKEKTKENIRITSSCPILPSYFMPHIIGYGYGRDVGGSIPMTVTNVGEIAITYFNMLPQPISSTI